MLLIGERQNISVVFSGEVDRNVKLEKYAAQTNCMEQIGATAIDKIIDLLNTLNRQFIRNVVYLL